ncbi:ATP-dependent helicase/nuclease subunit A [Thiogranum longum]|uniref:DNA 3'-5' helicase n=1 Tax=Thiogranum longum TaxID=1537524 RepID=A0A4V2PH08_9GAMM|nr:UvrD-helicase domain-containing protein [Thiogranum longum]TCK18906.1 ATP-dependent helicase/nuclease subunit A [Thiogranum longum]
MTDTPLATDPSASFSVLASAGTGKTWQLVARLTRLLLADAAPDSILAITFTRKAAGEMQQRLGERLEALLEADDTTLKNMLEEIGETSTPATCHRARGLLEGWLRSEHTLRTTTFHSFCQELLQRFPLEAGLPPSFELTETTEILVDESWDALFAEATRETGSELANALERLFEELGSLYSTRSALHQFVEHRSDWWALTRGAGDPADYATRKLASQLELDQQDKIPEQFWCDETREKLAEFSRLLGLHTTTANLKHIDQLEPCLTRPMDAPTAISQITGVFMTGKFEPRKRSVTATLQKKMSDAGAQHFIELHEDFCSQLQAIREVENRRRTLRVNSAWYLAGQRMLEHFQRIKRERRLLDFSDLEWKTFSLLNDPDHAHWIQYKLDQRIDHLLIDEFQDTNPTQWQMILPLLEEMAAGSERRRSVFIVGDRKQSIYRFRRGNPALLDCAADWMNRHLDASSLHLDQSRRSSPAIIDVVNTIFTDPDMQPLLPGFQPHSTHLKDTWGQVEVWPLITAPGNEDRPGTGYLRNPLQTPRPDTRDLRHYHEGQQIAGRIEQLVQEQVAEYGDILVLMRSRTHLSDYETALREHGIPYLSRDRGTLLESLEIRDMEALLTVLMTPQDNLALAQVLRSPLFSLDDSVLCELSRPAGGVWLERLSVLAAQQDCAPDIQRAAHLLTHWRVLAGRIPIHDLLEQIFHQANVTARYRAAVPGTQAAQVDANLGRFIELALEVDSGRYPTLPRFLERVKRLRGLDKEGLSKATPEAGQQRVNLLTIHAAKGLEAPVVFLCDTTSQGSPPGTTTLVRWPAGSDRPTDFLLPGNKSQRDSITEECFQLERVEDTRESANLLYVALTRARNMLIISGCRPSRGDQLGWYGQISNPLCGTTQPETVWRHRFGTPVVKPASATESPESEVLVDERLQQPICIGQPEYEIAPSRSADDNALCSGEASGQLRGIIIHRMLQLATGQKAVNSTIIDRIAKEQGIRPDDSLLAACREEVQTLFDKEELGWIFAQDSRQWNEVPVQYRKDNRTVYGIIDRLLVTDTTVHLIDYKSHRITDMKNPGALVKHYRPQLELYREAVVRLWPEYKVRCYLLFTHSATLVIVE